MSFPLPEKVGGSTYISFGFPSQIWSLILNLPWSFWFPPFCHPSILPCLSPLLPIFPNISSMDQEEEPQTGPFLSPPLYNAASDPCWPKHRSGPREASVMVVRLVPPFVSRLIWGEAHRTASHATHLPHCLYAPHRSHPVWPGRLAILTL